MRSIPFDQTRIRTGEWEGRAVKHYSSSQESRDPRVTASVLGLAAVLLASMLVSTAQPAQASLNNPELVSVSSSGEQQNSQAFEQSISGDGNIVAFMSNSSNLDEFGRGGLFYRNRQTGVTKRVGGKVPSADVASLLGTQTWTGSGDPYFDISSDGRYIAFVSGAPYDPLDLNRAADLYLFDISSESYAWVTRGLGFVTGTEGEMGGGVPSISADGRFVAFTSWSDASLLADANGDQDAFLFDRTTGLIELVSVNGEGMQGNSDSAAPKVSREGRYVVFGSLASNLVAEDTNQQPDVFIRDRGAGTTTRVSVGPGGVEPAGASGRASISGDGKRVAFTFTGANFPDERPWDTYVLVKDLETDSILSISDNDGISDNEGITAFTSPSISEDGAHVAWVADRFPSPDAVLVRSLDSSTTQVASMRHTGQVTSGHRTPAISADGRYIAFGSWDSEIVPDDTSTLDVFLRDMQSPLWPTAPKALWYAQTWGRGLHSASCTVCRGDPVNTATGNLTETITDLAMPGPGLPFRLSRTYNSADTSIGVLGKGWTHSYAASLTQLPDTSLRFRAEDGAQLSFMPDGNGGYQSLAGARSNLRDVTGGGHELVSKQQLVYGFDTDGKLVSLKDRNGNESLLSYTGGQLSSLVDTAGRTVTFSYDANGNLASVSLPDGRLVQYGYTNGLLTSVKDPRGNTRTYGYDASDRLTDELDQNGEPVMHTSYDLNGRVVSQTDARGKVSSFAWDAAGETSTMTDPRGKIWTDVYSNNLLQRQVDPLGNMQRYAYDEDLNIKKVINERGNSTMMTYDGRGNLLTRTAPAPLFYTETWSYNARNDVTSYVDGRGHTTAYDYDANGNLITLTKPGAVVTSFGRHPTTGQVVSVTDPRNKTTAFHYDADGNLARTTSAMGFTTKLGYDATGRQTSMIEARGNEPGAVPGDYTWTYSYNASDQITSVTDPLSNVTSYSYDPVGNLKTVTDGNNHTVSYGYNAAKDLLAVTAPDLSVTSYSYDPVGNLESRTNAENHTTTYAYDGANRLASVTSPEGDRWTYDYDAAGNLIRTVDANGNATATAGDGTITFAYDVLHRVTTTDYSDATPDVTFTYDANGNRTSMVDGAGSVTYEYDRLNRLTATTRGGEGFSYGYDAAGNVSSRTYPDETQLNYSYDDDGRMSTFASAGDQTTYTSDAAGNQTQVQLPNGFVETVDYDRAGRLAEIENSNGTTVASRFAYQRDAVGNPLSITSLDGPSHYRYDLLDRLTDVCEGGPCSDPAAKHTQYVYDMVGNRTQQDVEGTVTTYAHDVDDEITSSTGPGGTTTYAHDANGNLLTSGNRSYTYDQAGRMTSAAVGAAATDYTYDGDGMRRSVTGGTDVTTMLWDVNYAIPQLATEAAGPTEIPQRTYLYGTRRVAMKDAGVVPHYYHYDGVGSVVGMSSSSATAEWAYDYDAFGNSTAASKLDPLAPANPMRFTGEYLDATGLYHLRARQYDTSLGRFTATDPASPPLGSPYVSAYAYVNNQPTAFVDPTGEIAAPLVYFGGVALWKIIAGGAAVTAAGTGIAVAIDNEARTPDFAQAPVFGDGACDGWAASGTGFTLAREIEEVGDEGALREIFDRERAGGVPRTDTDYPGDLYELPGGTRVGWREKSSNGRPAVDRHGPEGSKTWHIPSR